TSTFRSSSGQSDEREPCAGGMSPNTRWLTRSACARQRAEPHRVTPHVRRSDPRRDDGGSTPAIKATPFILCENACPPAVRCECGPPVMRREVAHEVMGELKPDRPFPSRRLS